MIYKNGDQLVRGIEKKFAISDSTNQHVRISRYAALKLFLNHTLPGKIIRNCLVAFLGVILATVAVVTVYSIVAFMFGMGWGIFAAGAFIITTLITAIGTASEV